MFAVMPLSSPNHVAALHPVTGSHDVSLVEVALVVVAAVAVIATLAPSALIAIAVIAVVGAAGWLALRVAASTPAALLEAHRDAIHRATTTQISFAR